MSPAIQDGVLVLDVASSGAISLRPLEPSDYCGDRSHDQCITDFHRRARELLQDALAQRSDPNEVMARLTTAERASFPVDLHSMSGGFALVELVRFAHSTHRQGESASALETLLQTFLEPNSPNQRAFGAYVMYLTHDEIAEVRDLITTSPPLRHALAAEFLGAVLNRATFESEGSQRGDLGINLSDAITTLLPHCRVDQQLDLVHRARTAAVNYAATGDHLVWHYDKLLESLAELRSDLVPPLVTIAAQRALDGLRQSEIAIGDCELSLERGLGTPAREYFTPSARAQSRHLAHSITLTSDEYLRCRPLPIARDAIGFYDRAGRLVGFTSLDHQTLQPPAPVNPAQISRLRKAVQAAAVMEEAAGLDSPGISSLEWIRIARSFLRVTDALWSNASLDERAQKLALMADGSPQAQAFKGLLEAGAHFGSDLHAYYRHARGSAEAHRERQEEQIQSLVRSLLERDLPNILAQLGIEGSPAFLSYVQRTRTALEGGNPRRALVEFAAARDELSHDSSIPMEQRELAQRELREQMEYQRGEIEDDRTAYDVIQYFNNQKPRAADYVTPELKRLIAQNLDNLHRGISTALDQFDKTLRSITVLVSPQSLDVLHADPLLCPFPLHDQKELHLLLQHVLVARLQQDLGERFGVSWQALSIAEQFHLIRYLAHASNEQFDRVAMIARSNLDFAREFLSCFFSYSESEHYSAAVLSVMEHAEPKAARQILRKYLELIEVRDQIHGYLQRAEHPSEDRDAMRAVAANLVGRANQILRSYADRATNRDVAPENDTGTICRELDEIRRGVLLYGATFKALSAQAPLALADIRDTHVRVVRSEDLNSFQRGRLINMTIENSRDYPPKVRELVRAEFRRVIDEPGDRYYILEHEGPDGPEVLSFCRFHPVDDGTVYIGSLNTSPSAKGMKFGNVFLSEAIRREGQTRAIVGLSHDCVRNLAHYRTTFGFALTPIEIEGERYYKLRREPTAPQSSVR